MSEPANRINFYGNKPGPFVQLKLSQWKRFGGESIFQDDSTPNLSHWVREVSANSGQGLFGSEQPGPGLALLFASCGNPCYAGEHRYNICVAVDLFTLSGLCQNQGVSMGAFARLRPLQNEDTLGRQHSWPDHVSELLTRFATRAKFVADTNFCVPDTKDVSENVQKKFLWPRGTQQCVLPRTGNIVGHSVAATMCARFSGT